MQLKSDFVEGFGLSVSTGHFLKEGKEKEEERLLPPRRLRHQRILELNGAILEGATRSLVTPSSSVLSSERLSLSAPLDREEKEDITHTNFSLHLYGAISDILGESTGASSTTRDKPISRRRAIPLLSTLNYVRLFHPEEHGFVHASSNPDKGSIL